MTFLGATLNIDNWVHQLETLCIYLIKTLWQTHQYFHSPLDASNKYQLCLEQK
jgi:hypothetical protein